MPTTRTVFIANEDTQSWDRLDSGAHVGSYSTPDVIRWIKDNVAETRRIECIVDLPAASAA